MNPDSAKLMHSGIIIIKKTGTLDMTLRIVLLCSLDTSQDSALIHISKGTLRLTTVWLWFPALMLSSHVLACEG